MDSAFQFCSFDSGTMPEYFRKKMKNNFFQGHSGEVLHMDSVFKFWFGNYSGIFAEKLKNCFFQRGPGRDSPYRFSFSVFQFWFRNYSGKN